MSQRSVLVTGGSGFIGRHLVASLLEKGEHVTLLLRPTSKVPDSFAQKITPIICKEWTEDGIKNCLKHHKFSKIYHLASYGIVPSHRDIDTMIFLNTILPSLLVRLAAQHGATMIMAGSSAEYAPLERKQKLHETHPLEETKLYGSSKAAGTVLALSVATAEKVSLKVFRLFNVYGSGEAKHRLLPSLLNALLKGQKVDLSAGQQIRDFIHVDDIVDALEAGHASSSHIPLAKVYNVCTGHGESVRHYCEIAASLVNASPQQLNFGALDMRPDETPYLVGEPSLIEHDLGWRAKYNLESGLKHTLASMNVIEV